MFEPAGERDAQRGRRTQARAAWQTVDDEKHSVGCGTAQVEQFQRALDGALGASVQDVVLQPLGADGQFRVARRMSQFEEARPQRKGERARAAQDSVLAREYPLAEGVG